MKHAAARTDIDNVFTVPPDPGGIFPEDRGPSLRGDLHALIPTRQHFIGISVLQRKREGKIIKANALAISRIRVRLAL
jgi:hypothetical protein